jgi:hypothetical protein
METQENEASTVSPGEAGAMLMSVWSLPFTYARMMHDLQVEGLHAWARALWAHGAHHAHEPPNQLEIPDPIADALEQDLFA